MTLLQPRETGQGSITLSAQTRIWGFKCQKPFKHHKNGLTSFTCRGLHVQKAQRDNKPPQNPHSTVSVSVTTN